MTVMMLTFLNTLVYLVTSLQPNPCRILIFWYQQQFLLHCIMFAALKGSSRGRFNMEHHRGHLLSVFSNIPINVFVLKLFWLWFRYKTVCAWEIKLSPERVRHKDLRFSSVRLNEGCSLYLKFLCLLIVKNHERKWVWCTVATSATSVMVVTV